MARSSSSPAGASPARTEAPEEGAAQEQARAPKVEGAGGDVRLTLDMDARAYRLAAKLLNPLIHGMVKKAIESDMDAVKAYCEAE